MLLCLTGKSIINFGYFVKRFKFSVLNDVINKFMAAVYLNISWEAAQ